MACAPFVKILACELNGKQPVKLVPQDETSSETAERLCVKIGPLQNVFLWDQDCYVCSNVLLDFPQSWFLVCEC